MWPLEHIQAMNTEPMFFSASEPNPVKGFLRRKALLGGQLPPGEYTVVYLDGSIVPIDKEDVQTCIDGMLPVDYHAWEADSVRIRVGDDAHVFYWDDYEEGQ